MTGVATRGLVAMTQGVGRLRAFLEATASGAPDPDVTAELYRVLAENSSAFVTLADANGILRWASPSATTLLGWSIDGAVGRATIEFLHPDDIPKLMAARARMTEEAPFTICCRVLDAQGAYRWFDLSIKPVFDEDGTLVARVTAYQDVQSRVEMETELDRRARIDQLTGLVNRSEALSRIERVTSHPPRTGASTALLFCDIDSFKDVNDSFGHAAGDEVLRVVSERIRGCIRSDDLAARIGGDELLVLLSGVHSIGEAECIAEKIRLSVEAPIAFGTATIAVSLSIGVTLTLDGESTDALIARADQAMYRAKTEGRNRIVVV